MKGSPMPAGPAAPDDAAAISALARSHAHAALQVLVEALNGPNPGERVAAAVALLNAGYGQRIVLDSADGLRLEIHAREATSSRPNGEGDAQDDAAWRFWLREHEG
jgi:HEAT repeat protein